VNVNSLTFAQNGPSNIAFTEATVLAIILVVNHTDTVTHNLTYQVKSEKKLKSVWFRLLFGHFFAAQ